MATFDLSYFKEAPLKGVMGDVSIAPIHEFTAALANYPNTGDIYRVCTLAEGVKIINAALAADDLDGHATPTVTWHMYLYDGTTTLNIVGTAGVPSTVGQSTGVAYADQGDAIGFVTDSPDWILYVKCIAGPATDAAGSITPMLTVSPHLSGQGA